MILELHNYVNEKVSVNFGKSKDTIISLMNKLSAGSRRGKSLRKLETYLLGEDQTIADMIDDI